MTLQEEVELLERKAKALREIHQLSSRPYPAMPKPWPSRLQDVDSVIREHMLSPSCTAFS